MRTSLRINYQYSPQITVYDVDDGYGKTWVHVPLSRVQTDTTLTFQRLVKDRRA